MFKLNLALLLSTAAYTAVLAQPTVTINTPVAASSRTIEVDADAIPSGTFKITKMEVYLDGQLKSIQPFAPTTSAKIKTKITCVTAGNHTVKVKAYQNATPAALIPGESSIVTAVTDAPPVITEISVNPNLTNSSYVAPASIMVTAKVTDDCGVKKVDFFLDDANGSTKLIGSRAAAPYQILYSNLNVTGVNTIRVVAYDDVLGLNTSTSSLPITIAANTAPTAVNITSVATATGLTTPFFNPGAIWVDATATDATGIINKMELYNGNTLLATSLTPLASSSAPNFNFRFTLPATQAAGTYNLRVKAYDNYGLSILSDPAFTIVISRCGDANEPANNAKATAPAVSISTPGYFGKIATATDVDWLKISLDGTTTRIALTGIGENGTGVDAANAPAALPADFDIALYASTGKGTTSLMYSDAEGTATECLDVSNLAAGTYYLKIYGYQGAFSANNCYRLITENGTCPLRKGSRKKHLDVDMTLMPNPAQNEVSILTTVQESAEFQVAIYDLTGREMQRQTVVLNEGDNVSVLDVSRLNTGIYMIRLASGNQIVTQKLSIEK